MTNDEEPMTKRTRRLPKPRFVIGAWTFVIDSSLIRHSSFRASGVIRHFAPAASFVIPRTRSTPDLRRNRTKPHATGPHSAYSSDPIASVYR